MVPSTGLLVALAGLTPSCDADVLSSTVDRDVRDPRISFIQSVKSPAVPKDGSASPIPSDRLIIHPSREISPSRIGIIAP